MDYLREKLGMRASAPGPMTREQSAVAERQRRIALRQEAIDIQVDVLRADQADARRAPRR